VFYDVGADPASDQVTDTYKLIQVVMQGLKGCILIERS